MEQRRALGATAAEWDELVKHQPLPSPFLRSWWVDHCAEGEPVILCFFHGGELVGGAAFQSQVLRRGPLRIERITCLGQGVLAPDHLDVLARESFEELVLRGVLDWLHDSPARIVDLDGIASSGRLGTALGQHVIDRTIAPFAPLPESGDAYLASLPGKLRSTVTRSRKRLYNSGVEFRRTSTGEISAAMDRLAELHEARWSDDSDFLDGFTRLRNAAVSGAETGDVVINELVSADGETIATELNLQCGGRVAFYQAGRRIEREWRGCGSVLRSELISRACQDGETEYDLLRGDEAYKHDWAHESRELLRCRFGVGPTGRAAASTARIWRQMEPRVSSAVAKLRDQLSHAPWRPHRGSRDELSR